MAELNEIREECAFDLNKYHVDPEIGFMLRDPLDFLPPYFDDWNNIAINIPKLVQEREVRNFVLKLPLLDHSFLKGHRQLRLAHLQLSIISSGYVWQDGDQGVAKVLPACLAVPFFHVSQRLGIQPVLVHASLVLANWALVDLQRPRELENLKCIYELPGGSEAEWFVTVTVNVELTFAKCLQPLQGILNEIGANRLNSDCIDDKVAKYLDEITAVVKDTQAALARMHDKLAAKTFFNVLRPFLGGWGGEGNSLPEGLIYEGIDEKPIKMTGGSAAQSTTLQVLDALLGVEHTQEKREFLVHMRQFMPPDHRLLITDLEAWPHQLRDFVLQSTSKRLMASYNACVSALVDLRSYHIGIVTKYIVVASKEANEGNYESLDNKGTGGTSLLPFLKVLRSDTEQKLIQGNTKKPADRPEGIFTNTTPHGSAVLLLVAAASTLAVGVLARHLQQ